MKPTLSKIGGILVGTGTALFLLLLIVMLTVSMFQNFGVLVGIVTMITATLLYVGIVLIMLSMVEDR